MEITKELTIVNPELSFKKVSLKTPTRSKYLLLAAEVDSGIPTFLFWTSSKKKKLIAYCKKQSKKIEQLDGVEEVVVFKSILIPPGKGKLLQERPHVPITKFDIVLLIQVNEKSALSKIEASDSILNLKQQLNKEGKNVLFVRSINIRRIDSVNHNKDGIFLFNFFYADDIQKNLKIWEYTADWFQQETGLDNSTLLLPDENQELPYTVINHCRWNSMSDILPSLIFKRSFKKFVLDNFYANKVAAIPILYKLA